MIDTKKEHYTLEELLEIIRILRSKEGCSWDRAQTHDSLLRYLVEETYEYIEAAREGDPDKQADELGDILLQVVLHAQIGRENSAFSMQDVIDKVSKKMIFRHPHVFGEAAVNSVDEILNNWEELKRQERQNVTETEMLKAVSKANPALVRAQKVIEKIKKYEKNKNFSCFDKESIDKINKMLDNNEELSANINKGDQITRAILHLVYLASQENVPLELALQNEVDKLIARFETY